MKIRTVRSGSIALGLASMAAASGLIFHGSANAHGGRNSMGSVPGDVNGDGRADLTIVGGYIPGTTTPWPTVSVGFSNGMGGFNPVVTDTTSIAGLASLEGDVNGDGCSDLIGLGGPNTVGPLANTIVVGMSDCAGHYTVKTSTLLAYTTAAANKWALNFTGDFNGDGKWDIATYDGTTFELWVAFSNGDGTFRTTVVSGSELGIPAVPPVGTQIPQFVTGDFNGDGKYDIALVGPSTTDIYVGFSKGNGSFTPAVIPSQLQAMSSEGPSQVLAGDFDGDGYADIALLGGMSGTLAWTTIPIAYGGPEGTTFSSFTNVANRTLAGLASTPAAQTVAGDFNGDGLMDIAVANLTDATAIPVAFSSARTGGRGSFTDVLMNSPELATLSTEGKSSVQPPKVLSACPNELPLGQQPNGGVCHDCFK